MADLREAFVLHSMTGSNYEYHKNKNNLNKTPFINYSNTTLKPSIFDRIINFLNYYFCCCCKKEKDIPKKIREEPKDDQLGWKDDGVSRIPIYVANKRLDNLIKSRDDELNEIYKNQDPYNDFKTFMDQRDREMGLKKSN